ncbi:tail fiber domain-containing protein [Panacibacter ginsenosidivorans]|uniref:Tail fiber domain-containing protein n=1 Tax=Panacibacter ginsenosidivorans TaxID=1813871 RepID=A0A5B8VEE1_9BACT|nr:tail fiber domain-containing protein [Panacibacter ginsenosidivorans]QEC69639.1 tail fiber domain-containing protein [Panacibacter ginsenosidivorans]
MKTRIFASYLTNLIIGAFFLASSSNNANAQNIFPATGRVGIYTTSPAASLHVRGGARIGTAANYVNIDSATGNLSFAGTSAYRVAGNKYAFQYSGNTNYGLFFNSTNVQYEFRNGSAVPVFSVNANTGNSVFNGTLKVGAYTLPATDGTNGQVLKTNGAGVLTWSNDNVSAGSGWSLTGNAGTDANTNFIGTTDAQSLVFKVNGLRAGLIDYSTCCSGTRNTSFGQIALNSVTSGADNTAMGYGTLYTNTTGNQNAAYGKYALFNNNADNNTAIGFNAMFFNTTGINNTASGSVALQNNTTGQQNTANGFAALASNSTGSYNTAVGSAALNNNTADYNTATGAYALYLNTTGTNNTANGYTSLYINSTGNYNTASGNNSLHDNTTGSFNTATGYLSLLNNQVGSYNTAAGVSSLEKNVDGSENTAFGYNALNTYRGNGFGGNTAIGSNAMRGNDNGSSFAFQGSTAVGSYALYNATADLGGGGGNFFNTAIGYYALYSNTIGHHNVSVGAFALDNVISGRENTAIGVAADVNSSNTIEATAIGYNSIATGSFQVRIGSASVTSIGGQVGWTTISDGRVKKNIKADVPGLAFIKKLQPVTYNIDLEAFDKIVQKPQKKDANGKIVKPSEEQLTARKAKEAIIYTGFVAQDVEKAAKSLNYDFSGVDAAKNNKDLYGLRYSDFVVPLVKAVQELSAKNDDLQRQIDELKTLITANSSTTSSSQNINNTILSSASLDQNIPNPFANTTTINYTLPQKFTTAQIVITDKNGKTLKAINVSGTGKGNLKVDAATLASGAYSYSLVVNGKLIGTKEMILAK